MIVSLNQVTEAAGSHPADEGHYGLEQTKEKAHAQEGCPLNAVQNNSASDRYGKTVDGKTDGK